MPNGGSLGDSPFAVSPVGYLGGRVWDADCEPSQPALALPRGSLTSLLLSLPSQLVRPECRAAPSHPAAGDSFAALRMTNTVVMTAAARRATMPPLWQSTDRC